MTVESLFTRVLDPDIQFLIRAKARQLVRGIGFGRCDREDLVQELTLRLLQRVKAYDPAKASFYCFALVVLDRVGKTLIEAREAACRDSSSTISLQTIVSDPEDDFVPMAALVSTDERSNRTGRFTDSEIDACDLSLNVQSALATLPAKLRRLARRLVTASRAEIRRQTGESETRQHEQFVRLRAALEHAGLRIYLTRARE